MAVNYERIRTISLDSVDGIMVYTLPRMVVLGVYPAAAPDPRQSEGLGS